MNSKLLMTSVLLAAVVFLSALIGEAQTCAPLALGCLDYTFGTNGTSIYSIPNALSSVQSSRLSVFPLRFAGGQTKV